MSSEASEHPHATASRGARWLGWILSVLPCLLLVMSGVTKVTSHPDVVEGFSKMGFPAHVIVPIGIVELVSTALYLIPKFSPIGAILLTGYLGGATVTHVRDGSSWVMPVALGVVLWVGLVIRDRRLHSVLPWNR